jgi:AcrR family transcriptional regulator
MKAITKSDETRTRIRTAAIELFRRKGFEQTTMREIAAEAGVATGAAYYYFDSKDAIVLAFYDQAQKEMEPLVEAALAVDGEFAERLHALLEVKLRYFEPNRTLLRALAAHTDPEHPLSPFSAQTREIRERDTHSFERVLTVSGVRVTKDLKPHLPRVLWMYQMGLILFWIYDRSEACRRTRRLIERSLPLVVRLIKLSGYTPMRPVRRMIVELVETLTE